MSSGDFDGSRSHLLGFGRSCRSQQVRLARPEIDERLEFPAFHDAGCRRFFVQRLGEHGHDRGERRPRFVDSRKPSRYAGGHQRRSKGSVSAKSIIPFPSGTPSSTSPSISEASSTRPPHARRPWRRQLNCLGPSVLIPQAEHWETPGSIPRTADSLSRSPSPARLDPR